MIKVTFPDKTVREYEKNVTPYEIAFSISEGLARNVLAAKVNGVLCDLGAAGCQKLAAAPTQTRVVVAP